MDRHRLAQGRHRQPHPSQALRGHPLSRSDLRRRRCVHHRRCAPFRLLHVGAHRVPLREVMALRSPDLSPARIEALGTPFERDRQGRIEAVKIGQQIGSGPSLGERAASTAQRAPRPGEGCAAPLRVRRRPAANSCRCPSPRPTAFRDGWSVRSRLHAGFMGLEQAQGREVIHKRPAGIDRLPKARRRRLYRGMEVNGPLRVPCGGPSSSSRRPSTTARRSSRMPRWIAPDRKPTQHRPTHPAPRLVRNSRRFRCPSVTTLEAPLGGTSGKRMGRLKR